MGIGHPGDKELVHAYVLSDFAKASATGSRTSAGLSPTTPRSWRAARTRASRARCTGMEGRGWGEREGRQGAGLSPLTRTHEFTISRKHGIRDMKNMTISMDEISLGGSNRGCSRRKERVALPRGHGFRKAGSRAPLAMAADKAMIGAGSGLFELPERPGSPTSRKSPAMGQLSRRSRGKACIVDTNIFDLLWSSSAFGKRRIGGFCAVEIARQSRANSPCAKSS